MAKRHKPSWSKPVQRMIVGLGFAVVVVLLLVWLAGGFTPKLTPEHVAALTYEPRLAGDMPTTAVRDIVVPQTESAVGTIRAVHETAVASKLLAKVVEVNARAGQPVGAGDVLVVLDDADLKARLRQAEASEAGARAARDQAKIELDRISALFEKNSAAKIERDRVRTAYDAAEAELSRAEQAVNEARTILEYATIKAPISGIIVDKRIEVGDTASPGQVLLTLYDPTRMQLVARVRESLTQRLAVGQDIGVRIDALDKICTGQISEIVPEAESTSRSFSVKVTGPCPPGIYSGMFGRILIPLGERHVTVVDRRAVRQVGQLDVVDVVADGSLTRRIVQLGRSFDDDVEVLAGLTPGESVAIAAADAPGQEHGHD